MRTAFTTLRILLAALVWLEAASPLRALAPYQIAVSPLSGGPTNFYSLKSVTADSFDRLLRSVGESNIISLGPGIFPTRGSYSQNPKDTNCLPLRQGWTITGSGPEQTTIKLVDLTPSSHYAVVLWNGIGWGCSSLSISNLTIDCNAPDLTTNGPSSLVGRPMPALTIEAIQCHAKRATIRNVHVVNASGDHSEAFVIRCLYKLGGIGEYLVDSCRISNFYDPSGNGRCSAITIFGNVNNVLVTNCVVSLNFGIKPGVINEFAYSYLGVSAGSVVFRSNVASNCSVGFHSDTPPCYGPAIVDNQFLNCKTGIDLFASTNVVVSGNIIRLPKDHVLAFGVITTSSWLPMNRGYPTSAAKRTTIIHNDIGVFGDGFNTHPNTCAISLYPYPFPWCDPSTTNNFSTDNLVLNNVVRNGLKSRLTMAGNNVVGP